MTLIQVNCPEQGGDGGTGEGNNSSSPGNGTTGFTGWFYSAGTWDSWDSPDIDTGDGTGGGIGDDDNDGIPDNNDTDCHGFGPNGCPEIFTLPIQEPVTELQKIQNLFNDYPTLLSNLETLAGQTDLAEERGKFIVNSTSIVQNPPIGQYGFVTFDPTPNGEYICIAHTHNAPANVTYSIFSWGDLTGMAKLLKTGKIDASRFASFLFTEDGTKYALTISDVTKFSKFFALGGDPGFDMEIALKRAKAMEDYYLNETEDPLILENSTPAESETNFLNMLQQYDMGLTLFEANADLTSFIKLTP